MKETGRESIDRIINCWEGGKMGKVSQSILIPPLTSPTKTWLQETTISAPPARVHFLKPGFDKKVLFPGKRLPWRTG